MMKIYQSRKRTKNLCFQKSRTIKFSQGKCPREFHKCRQVKRRRLKDSTQLTPCTGETVSVKGLVLQVCFPSPVCFLLKGKDLLFPIIPMALKGRYILLTKGQLLGALRNLCSQSIIFKSACYD